MEEEHYMNPTKEAQEEPESLEERIRRAKEAKDPADSAGHLGQFQEALRGVHAASMALRHADIGITCSVLRGQSQNASR